MEFLENVLAFSLKQELAYSHQSVTEVTYLHKKELLKYHESFPILVFQGSLSREIAL